MQRISVSQAILDIKVHDIIKTIKDEVIKMYNIMPIYEANFDVLFSRNSSQIGKQTTICWWVFRRKRQTHSGKSLVVSFCRVTTTAEAEEDSQRWSRTIVLDYQLSIKLQCIEEKQYIHIQICSIIQCWPNISNKKVYSFESILCCISISCVSIVILRI